MPQAGDKISLATQLYDNATNKFPVAIVRDDNGDEIAGSPFTLPPIEAGLYADYEEEFPSGTDYLQVQYFVYTDEEHTILDESYGSIMETITKESGGGGGGSTALTSSIIGVIDGGECQRGKIEDMIIRGEKRILNIRLVRADSGEPYDLSDADTVTIRLLNEDETVLEVEGDIISGPVGKTQFILTKTQTAALMPGRPSAFTMVIEFSTADIALANFPYQLEVVDPSVRAEA